jgi:hypothetical protein
MSTIVSLLVALIGGLVYALAPGGKASEIGRIMFFCGLLATLMVFGGARVVLGR